MDSKEKLRVLFVCTHNSARSQMAETFLNALGRGRFEAESAGLEPRDIHPLVVEGTHEEKLERTRKIRDEIKVRIERWIEELQ